MKREARLRQEFLEPIALERHAVIVVEVIEADDRVAPRQQPLARMKADESGRACYEELRHHAPRVRLLLQQRRPVTRAASRSRGGAERAPASLSAICGSPTRFEAPASGSRVDAQAARRPATLAGAPRAEFGIERIDAGSSAPIDLAAM